MTLGGTMDLRAANQEELNRMVSKIEQQIFGIRVEKYKQLDEFREDKGVWGDG